MRSVRLFYVRALLRVALVLSWAGALASAALDARRKRDAAKPGPVHESAGKVPPRPFAPRRSASLQAAIDAADAEDQEAAKDARSFTCEPNAGEHVEINGQKFRGRVTLKIGGREFPITRVSYDFAENGAECGRCGEPMSSADGAECLSQKCAAFRAFAAEHADDTQGDYHAEPISIDLDRLPPEIRAMVIESHADGLAAWAERAAVEQCSCDNADPLRCKLCDPAYPENADPPIPCVCHASPDPSKQADPV